MNKPNTVETNKPEFGAEPKVSIRRLDNRLRGAQHAVALGPSHVRILIEFERRIECEGAKTEQQYANRTAHESRDGADRPDLRPTFHVNRVGYQHIKD